jgi:two-component system, LytTR family, sensor kinase
MNHPVLGNRAWLIVWGLTWLFLAAGQSVLFYLALGNFVYMSIADSLLSLLIYSGIALTLWYPFKYFNSGERNTISLASNLLATGAITILMWLMVTRVLMMAVMPEENDYKAFWDLTLTYRIATGVFIYALIVLAFYLFQSLMHLSEKNAKEAKLENIVKETELRLLRSQINPHFLFNSLNSISSLTITDPEKARDMIVKLSEFMRYALSRKDEQLVTLRSELENLRLYLEIEKVRFGERLSIEELIEEECLDFRIPVLLLQPLYENAIKHGVYESTESVKLTTRAAIAGGFITIAISNNYNPAPSMRKGTGTGLTNVARRMELSYGSNASIKTSRDDSVFTVTLYMPV